MTTRKIRVSIDPLGNTTVDAQGFQGQGCADATKVIEQALMNGSGEMESVMKPEWNETEDVVNIQEVQQGW